MNERLRVGAAVLWTVVILILCWTPQVYLPTAEDPGSWLELTHLDKVIHAGIFVVFSFFWLRTTSGRFRDYLMVLGAGIVLAVVTEIIQTHPFINRDGELGDGLTDMAGVIAGFPVYRVFERFHERRRLSRVRGESAPVAAVESHA